MWQQKENLFSDRFVVPTWLKRATIYSHVSLLEENVTWCGWGFLQDWQTRTKQGLSSPQGQKAALLLRIHHTSPAGKESLHSAVGGTTHANHTKGWNAEPARLMQVDIMVGYLKLHLLQISLEILAPDTTPSETWNPVTFFCFSF